MSDPSSDAWLSGLIPLGEQSLKGRETLLVLLLLDDSSSMRHNRNDREVIAGHDDLVRRLKEAPGDIRIKTMFLNNRIDIPFAKAKDVASINGLYDLEHGTPLFARTLDALREIEVETARLERRGMTVHTVTFILTDGGNSDRHSPSVHQVAAYVESTIGSGKHIVAGLGIFDGCTNFRQVFDQMGIPEQWVLVLGNNPEEVHQTFHGMADISVSASMVFDRTMVTGFIKTPPTKP